MNGSPGATMGVDWEQRVDFDSLRHDRLAKAKAALEASDLGGAAALRPEQHPLRHQHAHRGVGARQERPLRPADARARPDPVGLRVGGPAPPAVRPVAAGGVLPRRGVPDARRDARRDRDPGQPRRPDRARAARKRPRARAGRHRHDRHGHAQRPAPGGRGDGRRLAGDAVRPRAQDARRDRPARARRDDRRRRLRGDLPDAAAGGDGVRDRRPCDALPVRARLGAGGGHQRGVGPALEPAPARVLRPPPAPGGHRVLRHHPLVHGLPDVLLPLLQRRRGQPVPARRLQAVPGVARRGHLAHPPRPDHGRDRACLAVRRGARLPGRGGVLRPAVRARPGRRPLRVADDLAAALARPPGRPSRRTRSSRSRRTAPGATASPRRGSRRRSS